ncbi:MAG: TlpA family protein disulfide reductase [Candidatus Liptonbacteria bacterium]|nr:TlpA family protein disulfide reductase [Candidatus Liptonbacteria bacterium]
MRKTSTFIIVAIVLAALGFAVFRSQVQPGLETSVSRSENLGKAPDFSLSDYGGKKVSLSDFVGKPLVINSWAAWCPFCREELPDFVTVQKEFEGKVVFIAIDRGESLSVAKKYTDELGVTASLILLLDPDDSFYGSVGGFSMPETIFVDKEGVIRDHKRGPMAVPEIRERTQKIL